MIKPVKLKYVVLTLLISSSLLLGLVVSFTLYSNYDSWAGDRAGKVIDVRNGKLEQLIDGVWKQVKNGDAVSLGSRLMTDHTGIASVEVSGIGRFVMAPGSEFEIGKDITDVNNKLSKGTIWMDAKISRGGKASVATPVAITSIKGTRFTVVSDGNKFCACTCVGEVEVTTNSGRVVKLPAGEFFAFTEGEPLPDKPRSALPELEKRSAAFDFCFNCHIAGGKGKLKRDWERFIS